MYRTKNQVASIVVIRHWWFCRDNYLNTASYNDMASTSVQPYSDLPSRSLVETSSDTTDIHTRVRWWVLLHTTATASSELFQWLLSWRCSFRKFDVHVYRVPTLLQYKNFRTFPGLCHSPAMFSYKETNSSFLLHTSEHYIFAASWFRNIIM